MIGLMITTQHVYEAELRNQNPRKEELEEDMLQITKDLRKEDEKILRIVRFSDIKKLENNDELHSIFDEETQTIYERDGIRNLNNLMFEHIGNGRITRIDCSCYKPPRRITK